MERSTESTLDCSFGWWHFDQPATRGLYPQSSWLTPRVHHTVLRWPHTIALKHQKKIVFSTSY
eukprot:4618775-Amphidinium_carterae.1